MSLYLCQKVKLCSKGFSVVLHDDRVSLATLLLWLPPNVKKDSSRKVLLKTLEVGGTCIIVIQEVGKWNTRLGGR